ncbi:jg20778, partial [Pararge aegeria aegeria]
LMAAQNTATTLHLPSGVLRGNLGNITELGQLRPLLPSTEIINPYAQRGDCGQTLPLEMPLAQQWTAISY